jgi:hypothetical protein
VPFNYSRMHLRRRAPYAAFRNRRAKTWVKAPDRDPERRAYRPWGAREAFPHPLLPIPGYWVRGLDPRWQECSWSRCFSRGRFSRF